MKTFDVYQRPNQWGCEAIKRGFSWPAFIFTWMWAFAKELWAIGFAFLAIVLAIVVLILVSFGPALDLDIEGSALASALFGLGASVFFGINGNEWKRLAVLRAGWVRVERINAKSASAAIEQYTDSLRDARRGGAT